MFKKKPQENHYCLATFYPPLPHPDPEVEMVEKSLFLFEDGPSFTDDDIEQYIMWFFTGNRVCLDEIEYRIPLEKAKQVRKDSNNSIEWNHCSRAWFKCVEREWKEQEKRYEVA